VDRFFDFMFKWQVWVAFVIIAIVADFIRAKYVYHDLGCMIAECRKFKH
jgi:hypothetical protein